LNQKNILDKEIQPLNNLVSANEKSYTNTLDKLSQDRNVQIKTITETNSKKILEMNEEFAKEREQFGNKYDELEKQITVVQNESKDS
jgi:hypothetical protein